MSNHLNMFSAVKLKQWASISCKHTADGYFEIKHSSSDIFQTKMQVLKKMHPYFKMHSAMATAKLQRKGYAQRQTRRRSTELSRSLPLGPQARPHHRPAVDARPLQIHTNGEHPPLILATAEASRKQHAVPFQKTLTLISKPALRNTGVQLTIADFFNKKAVEV